MRRPSDLLSSSHRGLPQLFALFRNDLRLPADKLALKLEQILRFPRMNNFMRKVEGVGERLLGQ